MADEIDVDRRTVLTTTGGVLTAAALAGCGGGGNGDDGAGNTVAVGPNDQFRFDPEEITISVGETVTWEFESSSHNVCAWPTMFDAVSGPVGADGFGTMPQSGSGYEIVDQGETFEHTFETAGEYTYVCGPHANQDMIGTVVVE